MKFYPALFTLFTSLLFAKEELYLNAPFSEGTKVLTKGGALFLSPVLSFQAEELSYDRESKRIEASGSLLVYYKKQFFLAKKLVYLIDAKEGWLENIATKQNRWNVIAESLFMNGGKEWTLKNLVLSPYTSSPYFLSFRSIEAHLDQETLTVNHPSLYVGETSILSLPTLSSTKENLIPSFQASLDVSLDSYPELSIEYPLLSHKERDSSSKTSLLLSYEPKDKIELEVSSKGHSLKNRWEHISSVSHTKKEKEGCSVSQIGYTIKGFYSSPPFLFLSYNKKKKYTPDPFDQKRIYPTQIHLSHQNSLCHTLLSLRSKLNSFQGFKQELPKLKTSTLPFIQGPFSWKPSLSLSYLNYSYPSKLHKDLSSFEAGRFELDQVLETRPISSPLTVILKEHSRTIFYTRTPEKKRGLQHIFQHETLVQSPWILSPVGPLRLSFFDEHTLSPKLKTPYIFDLNDGFHELHCVQLLLAHSPLKRSKAIEQTLLARHFYGSPYFTQIPSEIEHILSLKTSSLFFEQHLCWNLQTKEWNFIDMNSKWTYSEDFALSLSLFYRGPSCWRKGNRDSRFLNVAHPEKELLDSPLSQEELYLSSKWLWRFHPKWSISCQHYSASLHPYLALKTNLTLLVSPVCQLDLCYEKFPNDQSLSFSIEWLSS